MEDTIMKQEKIIDGEVLKTFILITVGCTYSVEKITLRDDELRIGVLNKYAIGLNEYSIDPEESYPMRKSYGMESTCKISMMDLGEEIEINDGVYLMRLA